MTEKQVEKIKNIRENIKAMIIVNIRKDINAMMKDFNIGKITFNQLQREIYQNLSIAIYGHIVGKEGLK